jgi:prepilin-type N-terminal cleavage/methylation domain-containing protein
MAGRRGARGGFTLIEILIAMVVLLVGIVGIVAIFPVGIRNTADATIDTFAANLAESVHASLVMAHRQVVVPAPAGGGTSSGPAQRPRLVLVHDLSPGNAGTGRYEFELPFEEDFNKDPGMTKYPLCHPDPAKANAECFSLGSDPWLGETSRNIRATSDNTDMYWAYGFKFKVRKVPTIPPGGNSGLYEYTISVYRIPGVGPRTATGSGGGGGGTGPVTPISDSPVYKVKGLKEDEHVLAVLSARIAGP